MQLVRSVGDIQEGDLVEVVLSGERWRPACGRSLSLGGNRVGGRFVCV